MDIFAGNYYTISGGEGNNISIIMKLVGLSGISGSGKTHILQMVKDEFADSISILSFDNYYKPIQYQQKDDNGIENFDLPEGVDSDKFLHDLEKLKRGESVKLRVYKFNNPNAKEEFLEIKPAPVLFIEGIFVFYFQHVFSQLDYKIFVNASNQITLKRRLYRDAFERGITEEMINYQWENHALPGFEKYVSTYKDKVDMVIENEFNNGDAFNALCKAVKNLIGPQA